MIAIDSDRHAFLRAITEDPGSDEPRLVYADWLADHGEWEAAERIWEGIKNLDSEIPEVWNSNGEQVGYLRYNRGFVVVVETKFDTWYSIGPDLFSQQPFIKRVELIGKRPSISTNLNRFFWFSVGSTESTIERPIYSHMKNAGWFSFHATEKDAYQALSDACIDYAKTMCFVNRFSKRLECKNAVQPC